MSQQKPGWYEVPDKGRRYWNGSNYQFFGPSDSPASRGQPSVSGDIGGMWNNFVNQWGSSTKDPSRVGQQSFTQEQVEQVRSRRRNAAAKPDTPEAPTSPKPTATAQPPKSTKPQSDEYTVSGVTYNSNTGRPKGAPAGGYSLETDGTMTPHSSGGSGGGEPRTNIEGLRQYGQTLGGLNEFTDAFTGGYQLTDIKSAFQSGDLPATGNQGANTDYSVDDAVAMGTPRKDALTIQGGGSVETVIEPSISGTINSSPDNPQNGTSGKPDRAESIRQLRMARSEGSPRGFNGADFSGDEPDNSSLVSPMYANSKRNAIRSTFLDHEGSSVQAIAAANAVAGYGKDSDANARFNVGGKLVYAQDGKQQQAKNAAMMGQDPSQFLDIPTAADVQPDSPADSQITLTQKDMESAGQAFASNYIERVKNKNK